MGANYYDTLNVPRNASQDEIKRAYRTLTKKYHPDICKEDGADEKFKTINEAYSVLSDEKKRAQYDQYGHENYTNASKGSYAGGGGHSGGFNADFGGFGDIFDSFFGGGSRRPRGPRPGNDLLMRISVSLKDVALGTKRDIEVMSHEPCPDCDGTGSANKKTATCPRCKGTGQEQRISQTPFGQFASAAVCSQCHGTGKIPEERCKTCGGTGTQRKKRVLTVDIPAGIETGQRIRMSGYGEAGDPGGQNGDLYVEIRVEPSRDFTRINDNLESSVSISPAEAVLGTKKDIFTIDGRTVELKVPAGVQHGMALKIPGEGIKRRGRPGDLLVRVKINVPKSVSGKVKELYQEILDLEAGKKPDKKKESSKKKKNGKENGKEKSGILNDLFG